MKVEFVENLVVNLRQYYPEIDERVARTIIYNHIKNYDITEKDLTDIIIPDFTTEILLRAFKVYKGSRNVSKGTIEQYEIVVRQLCNYVGKDLGHISSDDIVYFLKCYKEDFNIKSSTMENKRLYLNSVFTTLHKHGKIPINPMAVIDPIKCDKKQQLPLSEEEIEKIFMACGDDKRKWAIVRLLLDTGCRANELVNIRMKDVDFTKRRIKVLGKGNKERMVLYGGATAIRLAEYLNERIIKEGKTCFNFNDPLIGSLVAPYDDPIKTSTLRNIIVSIGEKSGIERLHTHLFRHTCATSLARSGVAIEKIANYLGHANINTTARTYIHNDIDSTLKAIENFIA